MVNAFCHAKQAVDASTTVPELHGIREAIVKMTFLR